MYRVGQKVRCINPPDYGVDRDGIILHKGHIYTVKEYMSGGYIILKEFNYSHNFRISRFEVVDYLPEELFTL